MGGWPDHEIYELLISGRLKPRFLELPENKDVLKDVVMICDLLYGANVEAWTNAILSALVHIWVDYHTGAPDGPHEVFKPLIELLQPVFDSFDNVAKLLKHPSEFKEGGSLVRRGGLWLSGPEDIIPEF